MMVSRLSVLLRGLVALMLCLSLAGAGAAHQVPERPAVAMALAEFVAAGGSLADLCHDAGDGHGGGHSRAECPACTLQGAVVLPDDAATLPILPAPVRRGQWPADRAGCATSARLSLPPARGPPVPTFS